MHEPKQDTFYTSHEVAAMQDALANHRSSYLSLFDWVPCRTTKAAVKLHTGLDLHGSIPAFIHISDAWIHQAAGFFVICAKHTINMQIYPTATHRAMGVICDRFTL
jgi:hypothetical protein